MSMKSVSGDTCDIKAPLAPSTCQHGASPDKHIVQKISKKSKPQTNGSATKGSVPELPARSAKPPDGRWSWVILVATFFNYIVVSAIWYSFSVLYKEFSEQFGKSLASIGVLASVEAAALHFTGAMCSGLVEKYGSRPVAMVGSLVAALALFGGAFANNVKTLYVVYGVAGAGIGLSYVSFVVIIQQYFDKRRTIASGFSLTGFSVASFSLPPFTRWLLDKYGWRGTLMIISGFYLNGIVLAALLRPPPKQYLPKPRARHASFSQRLSRQMSIEKTKSRMDKFCKVCRKVFDYRMFKDVRFVLYGVGTFLMMVGNIAFFMHLVNKALYLGVEPHLATFLPSIYGIANGICRILFSVVANLPKCNRIIQYGAWIIAGGIISCLSSFATNFIGLAIVCAGFGMCVGAFICIQYPALVDLLGVHKIARSTGLLQLFIGAAGLIATPLAGWIYDFTGDYNIPYFVLGTIMTLGGGVILIIPCLERCGRHSDPNIAPQTTTPPPGLTVADAETGQALVTSENHLDSEEEDCNLDEDTSSCHGRMRTLSSNSMHVQARV